jgi:hypothetical protein
MDETLSVGTGYTQELDEAAAKGEITLDWHWSENKVNPATTPISAPQTVGFRMTDEAGTKIPEICEEWVNKVCTGIWKSVTGDLDLVSMTNADASPLSDSYYVNYLEQLGETSVANQHPTTSTWYSETNDGDILFDPNKGFADKAKYMYADKCCLLQVGADGVPRAVMLDLKGSWFTSKNDFYLRYVGTELVPAP